MTKTEFLVYHRVTVVKRFKAESLVDAETMADEDNANGNLSGWDISYGGKEDALKLRKIEYA